MASRGPAGAVVDIRGVIDVADEERAGCSGLWRLRVATEAEIGIADGQQLCIYRSVWVVASGAAFAHRGMFEDVWLRLFAMTVAAGFIDAGHGEATVRLHDVEAVRVVAIDAGHFAFEEWVVLRQMELRIFGEVTLKTGFGLFARVDDELAAPAAGGDVFAAGAVT